MSIEALRWALDTGEEHALEPTARHILLILGNRADEQGYLFPSISWISKRTGLADSTIRQHLKALETSGLLSREHRQNDAGGRTSDSIHLAMAQPGLDLEPHERQRRAPPTPPAVNRRAPSGKQGDPPPADREAPPPAAGGYTQDIKQEERTPSSGGGKPPSAVASAFQAYQQGMKAKYGADYPPSAKANGQLSQVVARIGGEAAVAVVPFYLNSRDPFYGRVKHALGYLVRDCERLWMDLQVAGGRAETAGQPLPTKAKVYLAWNDDGKKPMQLEDQPLGDPLKTAESVARSYARMIAGRRPDYLDVTIGSQNHRYTIAELTRQSTGARP